MADVRETFEQLRRFVTYDIELLLRHEHGGNYSVALLVAAACEGLSRLFGKSEHTFLVRLLTKHGLSDPMAEDVAIALRQGLAHVFDTRYIRAGPLTFELVVSWGARPHLKTQKEPPGLYLNVRTMWQDVQDLLHSLEQDLPPAGTPTPNRWREKRIKPANPASTAGWQQWFAEHVEAEQP